MADNVRKILKSHQLKATQGRLAVLELLINSENALSHTEIESLLSSESIDRVTIYRILDCFLEKEIIHKISSKQAIQLFAINKEHKNEHCQHAHLICDTCETITCVEIPINLDFSPNEAPLFDIHSIEITIHGICPHCTDGTATH